MKQKTYFIVLSVLVFVLNWVGFSTRNLRLPYYELGIYLGLFFSMIFITVMLGISLYFFIVRKNIAVLHCNMALNLIISVLFPSMLLYMEEPGKFFSLKQEEGLFEFKEVEWTNSYFLIAQIICALIISSFYFIGYFCFGKNKVNQTKNMMYIAGVSIFSVLLALTDSLNVEGFNIHGFEINGFAGEIDYYKSYFILNLQWFTIAAFVIGLGFYFLYCMGKATKPFAVGAIVINGILTITSILLNYLTADSWDSGLIIMFVGIVLSYLIFFTFALILFVKNGFINRRKDKENSTTNSMALDKIKDLENLYSLYKNGAITEDEFQTEKNKILGGK